MIYANTLEYHIYATNKRFALVTAKMHLEMQAVSKILPVS